MRKVHSTAHLVKPYVNVALYLIYQVITTNFGGNGPEAIFKVGDVNRKQHISQTTVSMSHKNMMWNTIALAASLKNNTARERSSNFIIQLLQYPSSFMSYRQRKIRGGGKQNKRKKGILKPFLLAEYVRLYSRLLYSRTVSYSALRCFLYRFCVYSGILLLYHCIGKTKHAMPSLHRQSKWCYCIS